MAQGVGGGEVLGRGQLSVKVSGTMDAGLAYGIERESEREKQLSHHTIPDTLTIDTL